MFHRLHVEQWQHVLTLVSFALFFCSFFLILFRALWLSRDRIQHLEKLPLDHDTHDDQTP